MKKKDVIKQHQKAIEKINVSKELRTHKKHVELHKQLLKDK